MNFVGVLPLAAVAVFTALGGFVCFNQAVDIAEYDAKYEKLHKIKIKVAGIPKLTQASIDQAMFLFSIKRPPWCMYPKLAFFTDLGNMFWHPYRVERYVFISQMAFTSWGMLGAVLAHEIEVHCTQNLMYIVLIDKLDKIRSSLFNEEIDPKNMIKTKQKIYYGEWLSEREAYSYQIENAERFGLSSKEVLSIETTRDYFYPPR